MVHGDTTTTFVAALASFYKKIKLLHVEAGLRTNNIYSPFPEEFNRFVTSKIAYMHSERFVQDMVKALQNNEMEKFKQYYRSVDALLIDDIQFFAGKDRTQEEFFHTFNALLEGNQQIILTSDRYPKEVADTAVFLASSKGGYITGHCIPVDGGYHL